MLFRVHFLCNYTYSPLEGDINPTHDTMWILMAFMYEWIWMALVVKQLKPSTTHDWTAYIDKVSLMLDICWAKSAWMSDRDQDSSELKTTFSPPACHLYILEKDRKLLHIELFLLWKCPPILLRKPCFRVASFFWSPFFSHLWGEHVSDAVHRSLQQQTSHQETEKHHVREERAEVHHLRERERERERERKSSTLHSVAMDTLFLRPHTWKRTKLQSCTRTRTHTRWINPQTALCLLGAESVKSYQMWRGLLEVSQRWVKNPSYSISGNHCCTDYDNWITKFSV